MPNQVSVTREQLERWITDIGGTAMERADIVIEMNALLTPPAPARDEWWNAAARWTEDPRYGWKNEEAERLAAHFRAVHEREVEGLKKENRRLRDKLASEIKHYQEACQFRYDLYEKERAKNRALPTAREIAEAACKAFECGGSILPLNERLRFATTAIAALLESKGEEGAVEGNDTASAAGAHGPNAGANSPPSPTSGAAIVEAWEQAWTDDENSPPEMTDEERADLARRIDEAMKDLDGWEERASTYFKEWKDARARVEELEELLIEWLDAPFFPTKSEWQAWVRVFRPKVIHTLAKEEA